MTENPEMPTGTPWQWCWQCGGSLWDWSSAYETTTFVGRVVLCRHCVKSARDVKPVENRTGLLGYRDRETWRKAKRKGKL